MPESLVLKSANAVRDVQFAKDWSRVPLRRLENMSAPTCTSVKRVVIVSNARVHELTEVLHICPARKGGVERA